MISRNSRCRWQPLLGPPGAGRLIHESGGGRLMTLTTERLREVLHYDPETGECTWLSSPKNRARAGRVAGSIMKIGYREISIDGRHYLAHRLVFFYMTGKWPADQVDHKNGDPLDNRWRNLRNASCAQNQHNQRRHRTNTSGFKGVGFDKNSNRWRARIRANGKRYWLGVFDTAEAAHAAYSAKSNELHGEFSNPSGGVRPNHTF